MNGDEFLQSLRSAEPKHCSFSSSKRQVRILRSIVEPATSFLLFSIADDLHGSAVRPQQIRHDDMWSPKALHCFSEEFQCCFAIPALGDITFKYLALAIYGAPQIVNFSVNSYEHLVQMPLPILMCP